MGWWEGEWRGEGGRAIPVPPELNRAAPAAEKAAAQRKLGRCLRPALPPAPASGCTVYGVLPAAAAHLVLLDDGGVGVCLNLHNFEPAGILLQAAIGSSRRQQVRCVSVPSGGWGVSADGGVAGGRAPPTRIASLTACIKHISCWVLRAAIHAATSNRQR